MVGVVFVGEDVEWYWVVFIDNICYAVDCFVLYGKWILVEVFSFGVKFYYFFFS